MRKLALILLTFVVSSCSRIDEIDINRFTQPKDDAMHSVAVSGNVTTETRHHSVTLSPVRQWNESQTALPEISRVFVLCGSDTIPYIEKASKDNVKTFVSEQSFKGETGKTYKLVIETPTGNITAEDSILPLSNTDYFQLMRDNIKIRTYQTHSGKTKYDFQFPKHIYTLSEQPVIGGVTFYSPEDLPLDSLYFWSFVHSDMSLQALFAAQTFYYSYDVSDLSQEEEFIIGSVSPEFYSYLLGVFNESDWSMGMFASISGNVKGNVNNGYGYFYATDIKRKDFTFSELTSDSE